MNRGTGPKYQVSEMPATEGSTERGLLQTVVENATWKCGVCEAVRRRLSRKYTDRPFVLSGQYRRRDRRRSRNSSIRRVLSDILPPAGTGGPTLKSRVPCRTVVSVWKG